MNRVKPVGKGKWHRVGSMTKRITELDMLWFPIVVLIPPDTIRWALCLKK